MGTKPPVLRTIGRSLVESIVELYRSLGFSLIIDLLWFVGYMPVIVVINVCLRQIRQPGDLISSVMVFLAFFCIWNTLAAGPIIMAGYAFYQERKVEYPSIKMFFRLFKKFYRRAVSVYGVFSVGASLLLMDITLAVISQKMLLLVAGIVSLYILLFITLMAFYFNPLIQLDNPFKKVIRKSFLLVSDNLGISLCFILVLGVLLVLSILLSFLFMLIFGPILIYFTDRGFVAVYNQYDS